MHVMALVAAISIGASLLGCESLGDPRIAEEDGPRCDFPVAGDRVHVEIRYAGDGTPSAVPDECTVKPGTRITWIGPAGAAARFELVFPGGSPAAGAARSSRGYFASADVEARQKVALVAGSTEGTYKYDISANGVVVDPAIIIKN